MEATLPLTPLAPRPSGAVAALPTGGWAGPFDLDVVALGRKHGRLRRWSYLAVADQDVAAGAAVVDLGYAVASFVWVHHDGRVRTWERKGLPGRHGRVPTTVAGGDAWFHRGDDVVRVGPEGNLEVRVGDGTAALEVDAQVTPDLPAFVVVPTARGGWNATQKVAGEQGNGRVTVAGAVHDLSAAGSWRDYTVGRQDRDTVWRWAAGAGRSADGRRVGLNLSTGMNEHPPGENLVWWDGVPFPLPLERLEPVAGAEGPWHLAGPGWHLDFAPQGVRAADENLLVVRSWYVQPIGCFAGTLPGPDGGAVPVSLTGVTEDHRARW